MSDKKFIYFLTTKDGRSWQIVNGVVMALNSPAMLQHAPDGNQEISIGWERSPVYHGNYRNFSLELGFVRDGATILRYLYYKFNIDVETDLLIKRFTSEVTPTTFKEYYKQFYKGELDFSTFKDKQGEYRVEVNIMDGGLQKLMKAAETTVLEIPFDEDAVNLKMDGMYIVGTFKWFIGAFESLAPGYPGLYQLNNDNPIPGLAIFDVLLTIAAAPTLASLEYFAQTTQDIAGVHLTGKIVDLNSLGASGPLSVLIYVYNIVSNTLRLTIDLTPDDPYPENYTLVIDETIDLLDGDRLFLYSNSHFEGEGDLQLSAQSKPETSFIPGFTLYDLGRKLITKVTGNAAAFQSTLLENVPIIITSGDGVRGIRTGSVKTTLRDYFKAVDAYFMAGMQINTATGRIRYEGREAFYVPESAVPAIELGEIKNFSCYPATDKMGTSIKVGHAEQQVDDTNGKFDFNGYQIYLTPIKRITSKELDLTSPWKASPYEIEQTRANYEGKTTTDKETDNNVFAIYAKRDEDANTFDTQANFFADGTPIAVGRPLLTIVAPEPRIRAGMRLRLTGSGANDQEVTVRDADSWFFGQLIETNEPLVDESGVNLTIEILKGQLYTLDRETPIDQLTDPDVSTEIKESVFNVPLSPARIFRRHWPWLAGVFHNYAPGKLAFDSNNRNREMIAAGIVEKADVPIADLGAPMFLPHYFEFDTLVPVNLVEILELNPNPVFAFTWKGNRYTGFLETCGIAPNTQEEQTFKLLACPENNILNLV